MPFETYYNLNEEKRVRVYQAVLSELARVPLEEASVKNIVDEAGIPRGSFYQYFSGKEDALRHVVRTTRDSNELRLLSNVENKDIDLFDFIDLAYLHEKVLIENCEASAKSKLLHQISKSIIGTEILFDEITSKIVSNNQYLIYWKNAGLNRLSQDEKDIVMELLFVSFKEAILETLKDISRAQKVYIKFKKKISIIKQGVRLVLV